MLGCSLTIADLELTWKRLRDGQRTLEDALALAERHHAGPGVMQGTADMLVALSCVARHRDDLARAADLLRRADVLGESAGLPERLPLAGRDGAAAGRGRTGPRRSELLDDAERVYLSDFSPGCTDPATRARVLVASGDVVGRSRGHASTRSGPDDELDYLRVRARHLAKVLLAEHQGTGAPETRGR